MGKLKTSGHKCPHTTAWQGWAGLGWAQLESFSSQHYVEFATKSNGLAGSNACLQASSRLHQCHIDNLANIYNVAQQGLFVCKECGNVAKAGCISGECAKIITSSGFYGNAAKTAKFGYGLAPLPDCPAPRRCF